VYLLLAQKDEVAKALDVFDAILAKYLDQYLVPHLIALDHLF